ncbi:hypothetical protein KA005_72975, partial [bacterium]|nr:hypothetical protein [bacterium]
ILLNKDANMNHHTYDPVSQLSQFLPSTVGKYQFSDSNAVHLMVIVRELLESGNKKETFSTLNLYCNWTVHPEITGSRSGYRTLSRIATALQQDLNPVDLADAVSQELSLLKLRKELIELLNELGASTILFDSIAGWEIFGGHFFKAILGKRLQFPQQPSENRRSANIYNEMAENMNADRSSQPKSLYLTKGQSENHHLLSWVVELDNGKAISGQLRNLENEQDFSFTSIRLN